MRMLMGGYHHFHPTTSSDGEGESWAVLIRPSLRLAALGPDCSQRWRRFDWLENRRLTQEDGDISKVG